LNIISLFLSSLIIFPFVVIHELGHFFFLKILKVPTKGILFLPFGGATLFEGKDVLNRWKNFLISLGGSVASLIYLLILIFLFKVINFSIFLLIFISIFNLLPIYPFDGGRIFLDLISGNKMAHFLSYLVSILTLLVFSLINLLIVFNFKTLLLIFLIFLYYFSNRKIEKEDELRPVMKKKILALFVYLILFSFFIFLLIISIFKTP
jgi:membrane-associated protease RseP (regulator of RpoE activity)